VLTPTEWSIVDAVRHGMSDCVIAKLRGISRNAVKFSSRQRESQGWITDAGGATPVVGYSRE